MIQRITRTEAQQLFDCMGVEVTLPVTPDYDWFAFYGGEEFPRGVVFSHYATNNDGLMGIIARPHVDLPTRELPKVEVKPMPTKQLPLPRKPPTFILPKRKCRNCGRLMQEGSKYICCSWQCSQEYAAMLARIEAADKEETEMPF